MGLFAYAPPGWGPPPGGGGSSKSDDGGGPGLDMWDTLNFPGGGVIGPGARGLGLGLGALKNALKGPIRTKPGNLAEKLALDEAKAGAGRRIMEDNIKDPRYLPKTEWTKMEHLHSPPGGNETIIHYWENLITGIREGFKFK